MLTMVKAWELRDRDVIVHKGAHYTLDDNPKPGPPGWTTLRCKDRGGLLVNLMIEGAELVNVVRPRDYTNQIRQGRNRGHLRRR